MCIAIATLIAVSIAMSIAMSAAVSTATTVTAAAGHVISPATAMVGRIAITMAGTHIAGGTTHTRAATDTHRRDRITTRSMV